jgi:hypothetical protein
MVPEKYKIKAKQPVKKLFSATGGCNKILNSFKNRVSAANFPSFNQHDKLDGF